ncbi:hypothetical protein Tcan_10403 [Toxocara canis]|uniref:Uncharacterized protein n=1 Tax=Toxocara canis TaxID=6265 RepID=A0A0B2VGJ5_TOXCA|nr:hypothetical protein Tcan_10403 [Toxocara canis]
MMIVSSFVATLMLTFAVHVCAQEDEVEDILPDRFIRSMPRNYVPSDLALRFGKRSWATNENSKRRIDLNDLALRFGKRNSYVFDPSNLNLRFGKRSLADDFEMKRAFVIPDDLALRFGRK